MWNVSASEHCCQHCDGVVFKPDSVMETKQREDRCQTVETSVCRVLPGQVLISISFDIRYKNFVSLDSKKAVVETEYNYKQCCYDEDGKVPLNSLKWEAESCSQRVCHYSKSMMFSVWISSQVGFKLISINISSS